MSTDPYGLDLLDTCVPGVASLDNTTGPCQRKIHLVDNEVVKPVISITPGGAMVTGHHFHFSAHFRH